MCARACVGVRVWACVCGRACVGAESYEESKNHIRFPLRSRFSGAGELIPSVKKQFDLKKQFVDSEEFPFELSASGWKTICLGNYF